MAVVNVNGTEFVIKTASASQVAGIGRIIAKIGRPARKAIAESGDQIEVLFAILAALDEETLVEFAALLIGSDKEFARENFDLRWVVEAFGAFIEETDVVGIVQNFTSMFSQVAT